MIWKKQNHKQNKTKGGITIDAIDTKKKQKPTKDKKNVMNN